MKTLTSEEARIEQFNGKMDRQFRQTIQMIANEWKSVLILIFVDQTIKCMPSAVAIPKSHKNDPSDGNASAKASRQHLLVSWVCVSTKED